MLVSDASEDENYIDTSDQEERDELIAGLQLSERSPSNDQLYTSQLFNSYTPRKRRKLSHANYVTSPRIVVPTIRNASIPISSGMLPYLKTATESPSSDFTILPSSSMDTTIYSPSLKAGGNDNNHIEPFQSDSEDDLGGYTDVFHGVTSTKNNFIRDNVMQRVSSPDPLSFTSMSEKSVSHRIPDDILSLPGSPSTSASDHFLRAKSLPIHIKPATPEKLSAYEKKYVGQEEESFYISRLYRDSFDISPLQCGSASRSIVVNDDANANALHFSPLRASDNPSPSIINPTISDPSNQSSSRSPSVTSHSASNLVDPSIDHPDFLVSEQPFEMDIPRRYSLRTRQARQLKPYEYDKMMYRLQLKDNPDAIVKVVSPSKDVNRRRNLDNGGHSNDFSHEDLEGDDFERHGRHLEHHPRHRRISLESSHVVFGTHQEKWYPEDLLLSDDELPFFPFIKKAPKKNSRDTIMKSIKLNHRKAITSSTHDVAPVQSLEDEVHETHIADLSSTLSSEKHLFIPSKSAVALNNGIPPKESYPENDTYYDHDEYEQEIDIHMRDMSISPQKLNNPQDPERVISIPSDEEPHSFDDDQKMTNSDNEESQRDETKKQRRALKALGRMMPAFMVSKVLKQRTISQADRRRSPSSYLSDDDDKLDIGRSKARRLLQINRNSVSEVRGDIESSDTDHDITTSPVLDDSSSDQDEGSEGDIVEASWFDNDVGDHYQYQDGVLPREDLIDRMLSRTGNGGRNKIKPNRDRSRLTLDKRTSQKKLPRVVRDSNARHHDGRQTKMLFSERSYTGKATDKGYRNIKESSPSSGQSHEIEQRLAEKKRKSRRKELQLKQTYLFPSDGKRISSGRRRNVISINVDDEGFHEALAPISSDRDGAESRPTTEKLNNRGESRESSHIVDPPLRKSTCSEADSIPENATKLTVDMDIPTFSSGLAFEKDTYLGKQQLHELLTAVSGEIDTEILSSYTDFDLHLHADITISEYSNILVKVLDLLGSWLEQPLNNTQVEAYQGLMRTVCRYSTFLAINADTSYLIDFIFGRLQQLLQKVQILFTSSTSALTNPRLLETLWFIVELTSRMLGVSRKLHLPFQSEEVHRCIIPLCKYLSQQHINNNVSTWIQDCSDKLSSKTSGFRAAEIWICLIHLVPKVYNDVNSQKGDYSIWSLSPDMVNEEFSKHMSDFEASEHAWRLIFNLCALSHFSSHGISTSSPKLPSSWDAVTRVLKVIRLTSNPIIDRRLSSLSLRKRDDYVRLVVARCYLLNSRWHWHLADAYSMFNRLVEIFKSRKFMNLRGEVSDFPTFLRQSNLSLLNEIKRADSAFSLFLKMIVQAVKAEEGSNSGLPASTNLKKLLSLAVPLSGVSFSKSAPPTNEELSMLYNRFSSLIIAILLEPTESNLRNRLNNARRYTDFARADFKSRQACIRALMHTAILTRHLCLPLEEPLQWLKDMTDTLLEEYRSMDKGNAAQWKLPRLNEKNEVILCIQLLLGCVRIIIETSNMEPSLEHENHYPDPALLNGPWIGQIFSTKDLTSVVTTSLEIRKLVQSFLHARSLVIPPPRRPHIASINTTESQESQDEFGNFDLDLDDPELISALENKENIDNIDDKKGKDAEVAKIMDESISPAIYRFITKHFSDPRMSLSIAQKAERYSQDTDDWIDCWVDCAAIIVRNGRRDWSHYLSLGPQSWERISDSVWRRRVGLRFMFKVLQSDPSAYVIYQDNFLELLLDSMVTANVTLEHEYISLVLSIDGMRHQMLHDLKIRRSDDSQDIHLSRFDLLSTRVELIDSIFTTLNMLLDRASNGQTNLEYQNQKWVGFILSMLSTMRDIFDTFPDPKSEETYLEFCREVYASLSHHPRLQTQARLAHHVAWGAVLEMET